MARGGGVGGGVMDGIRANLCLWRLLKRGAECQYECQGGGLFGGGGGSCVGGAWGGGLFGDTGSVSAFGGVVGGGVLGRDVRGESGRVSGGVPMKRVSGLFP